MVELVFCGEESTNAIPTVLVLRFHAPLTQGETSIANCLFFPVY